MYNIIYSYIINILLCLKFNVFYQYTNPYHFIYSDFLIMLLMIIWNLDRPVTMKRNGNIC